MRTLDQSVLKSNENHNAFIAVAKKLQKNLKKLRGFSSAISYTLQILKKILGK